MYSESRERAGVSEKSFVTEVFVDPGDFNESACPASSLLDPTCVVLASTHTAVQAGRLSQGGTSASSVSSLAFPASF